jgi:mRNA interferase MazF
MTEQVLQYGDVITVVLPAQIPQGREQEGYRPAIVVGIPGSIGQPRFNLLVVVPMTTDKGMRWAANSPLLYPRFPAGTASLPSASIALIDQVRAIDASRMIKYRGSLTSEQYAVVKDGLLELLHSRR